MDKEQKIRDRAHQIWESEGRPEGSHEEHWRRAEAEIATSEQGTPGEATENWRTEAGMAADEKTPSVMPTVIPPD